MSAVYAEILMLLLFAAGSSDAHVVELLFAISSRRCLLSKLAIGLFFYVAEFSIGVRD